MAQVLQVLVPVLLVAVIVANVDRELIDQTRGHLFELQRRQFKHLI